MKYFITKIKSFKDDSEKTDTICIEADTYSTAEQVGYKWAEKNCEGSFSIDSVVKSQIKEVKNVDETDLFYFLLKYEFGLESKPEKSNTLLTANTVSEAYNKGFEYLNDLCDGLFIPVIQKIDVTEYICFQEVSDMLGLKPDIIRAFEGIEGFKSITVKSGDEEVFFEL